MTIDAIGSIDAFGSIDAIGSIGEMELSPIEFNRSDSVRPSDFEKLIANGLNQLNQDVLQGEVALQKLVTGEAENLHEVMLSLEKSKTAFQFSLQLRNKVLEAYQEMMRMQL